MLSVFILRACVCTFGGYNETLMLVLLRGRILGTTIVSRLSNLTLLLTFEQSSYFLLNTC